MLSFYLYGLPRQGAEGLKIEIRHGVRVGLCTCSLVSVHELYRIPRITYASLKYIRVPIATVGPVAPALSEVTNRHNEFLRILAMLPVASW